MKQEHELLLELCKFQAPNTQRIQGLLKQKLDFAFILGQLLMHRMGGVAFYTLKECQCLSLVNREFRNTLESIYQANCMRTRAYAGIINLLGGILSQAPFDYAVLKGAYLASLYPMGLRTSNDVDVLIDKKNITELSDLLKLSGFRQGHIRNNEFIAATRQEIISSRMNRGETVPFIKMLDNPWMKVWEIDVNFSLDFKAKQETSLVEKILKSTRPKIQTDYGKLKTLSQVDFLVHLCVHLFKEATVFGWVSMGRDLSLYKFSDLYLFIGRFFTMEFVRDLIRAIKVYSLERECYYAFYYMRELYQMENRLLDKVLENIQPDDMRYLRQVIDPVQDKTYEYNMDFINWIFCYNREEHLYEI